MRTGRSRSGASAGWTLVELTIVITLITVLSTLALGSYRAAVTRAREAVLKEDLFRLRDAIDQYYADKQEYPDALEALVSDGYIRAVPEDPFTGTTGSWQAILAEPDPADPLAQGVFDVKTTYDGVALDGSPYSEW